MGLHGLPSAQCAVAAQKIVVGEVGGGFLSEPVADAEGEEDDDEPRPCGSVERARPRAVIRTLLISSS